jgi:hypothetical protein
MLVCAMLHSRRCYHTMITAVFISVHYSEQLTFNNKLRDRAATGKPNAADASHEPPLDVKRRDR